MHGRKIYHDKGPSHATHYILAANQDVLSRHSYFGSRVSNLKTKQTCPLGTNRSIRWEYVFCSLFHVLFTVADGFVRTEGASCNFEIQRSGDSGLRSTSQDFVKEVR